MRYILVGHGKMGRMIEEALSRDDAAEILGVVDVDLFASPMDVPGRADVLMDFSYPGNLDGVLEYARQTGCALVIGTTGLSKEQVSSIREAAVYAPIVYASNFSTGVAALKRALQALAPLLTEDFDVEIVETHHNQKADAPSGTAKTLLAAIDPEEKFRRVYGREGNVGKRGKEIGVHAMRGGTVAGEHSVYFFGKDETIELKHSASSREIFVSGALRAAKFAAGRRPGLYDMDDVLLGE